MQGKNQLANWMLLLRQAKIKDQKKENEWISEQSGGSSIVRVLK